MYVRPLFKYKWQQTMHSIHLFKLYNSGQAQWLKPVIPALCEAKAAGSQGQEIETILVNMVKPCLY